MCSRPFLMYTIFFCFSYLIGRHECVGHFKGSRQPDRRGSGNVSNDPNLARTPAIDVLFFINLAVIFDFMYFRFRPSKAKSIGNALTNRQNAAKSAQESC
jgi:hypothetical protein